MTHTILARPGPIAASARAAHQLESPARSDRPTDQLSWLWLVVGLALLPFSTVHAELPIAAWLAPIFVLRFARTQPMRVAMPVVALVSAAAMAFAWRDTLRSGCSRTWAASRKRRSRRTC